MLHVYTTHHNNHSSTSIVIHVYITHHNNNSSTGLVLEFCKGDHHHLCVCVVYVCRCVCVCICRVCVCVCRCMRVCLLVQTQCFWLETIFHNWKISRLLCVSTQCSLILYKETQNQLQSHICSISSYRLTTTFRSQDHFTWDTRNIEIQ